MSTDGGGPDRLKDLEARISAAKAAQAPPPRKRDGKFAGAGLAWRMMLELVVGAAVGLGMGYGLDSLFGTMPLFLILFTLLGFAAGVRVMLQSAADAQRRELAEAAKTARPEGTKGATAPREKGRTGGDRES